MRTLPVVVHTVPVQIPQEHKLRSLAISSPPKKIHLIHRIKIVVPRQWGQKLWVSSRHQLYCRSKLLLSGLQAQLKTENAHSLRTLPIINPTIPVQIPKSTIEVSGNNSRPWTNSITSLNIILRGCKAIWRQEKKAIWYNHCSKVCPSKSPEDNEGRLEIVFIEAPAPWPRSRFL